MNCYRKMARSPMAPNASKRPEPKGQNANGVSNYGDKDNMEYNGPHEVLAKPYWDGPATIIQSDTE